MAKKEVKDILKLLKKAESLKEVFGADITIAEIIEKLKIEEKNEENVTQFKFEDLRDFLIAKLIKNLIKRNVIEDVKPVTLKVLDRADLKDILEKYSDSLFYVDDCSDKEQNTAYLFYNDGGGGDAFEYLQQCIKASTDKWGLDKNINDFPKKPKDISIEDVKCDWLYKRNCDGYDCYNQTGSVIEILERKYRDESMLEYATVKKMYDFMVSPTDLDEDNEVQWLEVKRVTPAPTEIEFFLLMWKYFSEGRY